MKKPTMVAAALALGICAFGTRATAQSYDRTVEPKPDLQMRQMVPEMLSPEDTAFLNCAAAVNNAEIQMSQMAINRSSSSSTRDFAQRVLTDCQARGDELRRLANQWNVLTPLGADKYDKWVRKLDKSSDSDFDRTYSDYIHKLNMVNLDEYHMRSGLTNVGDIRLFVLKYLPAIRESNKNYSSMNNTGSK